MPELPEVETVRRLLRRKLQGRKILKVEVAVNELVFSHTPANAIESALQGRKVLEVGRKGKYFWLELDEKPWLFGHLGMSGWVESLSPDQAAPRFCKLLIESEGGVRIAITDGRRLGRLWLGSDPTTEKQIRKLGFDSYDALPSAEALHEMLKRRKAPIKAVLLDQALFAGVGNYLADEAMYQAKIAPKRLAASLSTEEVGRLEKALKRILATAVDAEADEKRYPEEWLFHHRWGGNRGAGQIAGHSIVRETIGGRTTAWVPDLQS
jgi:formamidopyrimidine-DNA glycosylase